MTEVDFEAIRSRFLTYLSSRDFKPTLRRLSPTPWWRLGLAAVLCASGFGIPIAVYQVYRFLAHRRSRRAELIRIARRATPIMTFPVMVNSGLLRTPGAVAPGLVLGSFDPEASGSVDFLAGLAQKVSLAGLVEPSSPDEEELASLMSDENYRPNRRRPLPAGLTGGKAVFAFDLMILGDFLPGGTLHIPMIPCLAEPGPSGRIAMIPWWIASGSSPAPALDPLSDAVH